MLLVGSVSGFVLGLAGPSDNLARFGRCILSATALMCLARHAFADLQCAWQRPVKDDMASCAAAALESPTWLAQVLAKAKAPWVRLVTLAAYLILVWV